MKKLRILPLLMSILLLSGCDLIDKIKGLETFDVDFDACYTIPVNISEQDPSKVVNEQFTINAADNPDLVDYLSNIENWDIYIVYVQVQWISGNQDVSFSGTVNVGSYSEDFTDIKPFEWADGRYIYLDLDEAVLKNLNEDMQKDNKIEGSVTGTVSDQPVNFIIYLCVEAVVEVKA